MKMSNNKVNVELSTSILDKNEEIIKLFIESILKIKKNILTFQTDGSRLT